MLGLPAGLFHPVAQLFIDVGQDELRLPVKRSSRFGQVFADGRVDHEVMTHLNKLTDSVSATDTDLVSVGVLNLHLNGGLTTRPRR